METKKEKFEVGDKVRVIDSGECYPAYYSMFKRMSFKDTSSCKQVPLGAIGTIFYMVQEESELFIGINYGEGDQALIGSEGVELVKGESKSEESIYKVGDTVYHYNYGKGSVTEIRESMDSQYPVEVYFLDVGDHLISKTKYFTRGGSFNLPAYPTLSFTEYNLVDGGFSQERPTPTIELPNIQSKWKYLTKRGPILDLWVDKPSPQSKGFRSYTSVGEKRHVGDILSVNVKNGLYKIKQ